MFGAAAIAVLPPPEAPPVGPAGAAGAPLERGRPSGHHPSLLRLHGKSAPSGGLIGAARGIAVARAGDDQTANTRSPNSRRRVATILGCTILVSCDGL